MQTSIALFSLLCCLLCISPNTNARQQHPVYISLTELHYKPEKNTIEIALKTFSDDIAAALSIEQQRFIEIGTEREPADATSLLQNHIRQHLQIYTADGKALHYEYIGREVERQDFFALWTYWEIRNLPTDLHSLLVYNTLLQKYYPTQNNIVALRIGNPNNPQRRSLTRAETNALFEW